MNCKKVNLNYRYIEFLLKDNCKTSGQFALKKVLLDLNIKNKIKQLFIFECSILMRIFCQKNNYKLTSKFSNKFLKNGIEKMINKNDLSIISIDEIKDFLTEIDENYQEIEQGNLESNYNTNVFYDPIEWSNELDYSYLIVVHHDMDNIFVLFKHDDL